MASKLCVFQSESIAYGRSNAGALLLLHSTTAGSMIKSETKLHDSEIYISHSITKTLRNDARLSLIGLRKCPSRGVCIFPKTLVSICVVL